VVQQLRPNQLASGNPAAVNSPFRARQILLSKLACCHGNQMKLIFILVGATLAASPAMAEPLQFTVGNSNVQIIDGRPRKITIHTVAPLRGEIRILGRTSTSARCEMAVESDYQVNEPPQHGALCFRIEKMPLKAVVGQASRCVGQEVMGRAVYYRPNGPYVGQDSFRYSTIVARAVIAINTAGIIVTKASSPFPEEEPSRALQAAGPMPQCPDVLM
jgi:hypothetical protein